MEIQINFILVWSSHWYYSFITRFFLAGPICRKRVFVSCMLKWLINLHNVISILLFFDNFNISAISQIPENYYWIINDFYVQHICNYHSGIWKFIPRVISTWYKDKHVINIKYTISYKAQYFSLSLSKWVKSLKIISKAK